MPDDFVVRQSAELARLGRVLRETGNKELRKELMRGLQRATKPMKAAAPAGAKRTLPNRGGLADIVAASKFTTRARPGGRNPSVRLVASNRKGAIQRDLWSLERGRLRHPVFGNRRRWVDQAVTPGWFRDTMRDHAPQARQEIVRVMNDVARRLANG